MYYISIVLAMTATLAQNPAVIFWSGLAFLICVCMIIGQEHKNDRQRENTRIRQPNP